MEILILIGQLYWIVGLVLLALALWLPKSLVAKGIWAAIVVVAFLFIPVGHHFRKKADLDDFKQRQEAAFARFDALCKNAGVKIYKTADEVEGIFLMKLRLEPRNFGDQFKMDDPYGYGFDGEAYVRNFLWGRSDKGEIIEKLDGPDVASNGYYYVELIHPKSGERTRYKGRMLTQNEGDARQKWETAPCGAPAPVSERYPKFKNCPVPITKPGPRYGVTYDDISTHEDREHWIAGSSLRVIDLETGEVMAERIGYMVDPIQGSRGAGRNPWLAAADNACPSFEYPPGFGFQGQWKQTRKFIEQVLKPKQLLHIQSQVGETP